MDIKKPIPPFNIETAKQKIQAAEDAWNSKDPEKIALAYTVDSCLLYTSPSPRD